jgi:hypothetical protein
MIKYQKHINNIVSWYINGLPLIINALPLIIVNLVTLYLCP